MRHIVALCAALALAAGARGNAIKDAIAACGPKCQRAGLGGTKEPGLRAMAFGYDEETEAFTVKWNTNLTTGSLLAAGNNMTGNLYTIGVSFAKRTAAAVNISYWGSLPSPNPHSPLPHPPPPPSRTRQVFENGTIGMQLVTPLFTTSTEDVDTGELIPGIKTWPADAALSQPTDSKFPYEVVLDPLFPYFLDNWPNYTDNCVVELIITDASGAPIEGGTFYSPLFPYYPAFPFVTLLSPKAGAMDDIPALVVAGATSIVVNWTVSGVPWTQGFDISFWGSDFNGFDVPVYDDEGNEIVSTSIYYNNFTNPIAPAVAVGFDADGASFVAYSAVFPMPRSASGCSLFPVVTASAGPESDEYLAWGGSNYDVGDTNFTVIDPLSLTTSIAVTAPAYNSRVDVGGVLTISWKGTNLLPTDKLAVVLTDPDTPSPSATWTWKLPDSFNPVTTTSYNITLAADATTSPPGYSERANAPAALSAGINYGATIAVYRPTFIFSGSSKHFKVLPANAPTMSVALGAGFPAVASFGTTVSLTYAITGFDASTMANLQVDLWQSTSGEHDPNGDRNVCARAARRVGAAPPALIHASLPPPPPASRLAQISMLSRTVIQSAGSGTVFVTIPADVKLGMTDSPYYFFGVMVSESKSVAAASPYFTAKAPWVTITAPTAGAVVPCGTALTVTWKSFGILPPTPAAGSAPRTGGLTVDLYTLDTTSGQDVFYTNLATGFDASLGGLTVTLPAAMTRGSYDIYAYNGPSFANSTAASSTMNSKFALTCPTQFNVTDFFPNNTVAAGDTVTLSYTVQNLPINSPLTVSLINNASGAVIKVLTREETYKGYFTLPTDPDVAYSNVVVKISDNNDPYRFGLSPKALFVTVATSKITVSAPNQWVAGKANSIRVQALKMTGAKDCTLDFYAYHSQFTGPQFVQRITTIDDCSKGTTNVKFTPNTTLLTTPYYYALLTVPSSGYSSRSPAASLREGRDPPGIFVLQNASSASFITTSSQTCGPYAPFFPPESYWAAPALCATTCGACVAAGGVWLTNVPLALTYNFSAWAGPEADKDDYAAKLGAMSTTDTVCWPAPAKRGAPVDTVLALGALPWVQSQHAAETAGSPFSTVIGATLTVTTSSAGLRTPTECAAPAAGSMFVNLDGLQPPATPSGSGMSRLLQAGTDTTAPVTVRDACNSVVAAMASVTANTSSKDYNCAVQSEGVTQQPANVPSSTAAQIVQPQDKLWDVIIVGAGGSGIAAAATALKRGYTVLMVEGRDRIGGRVHTDRSWKLEAPGADLAKPGVIYETGTIPVDIGASWIHGMNNNSITALADRFGIPCLVTPYGSNSLFTPAGRLSAADSAAADKKFSDFFKKVKAYINTLSADVPLQEAFDAQLALSLADQSVLPAEVPMLRYQLVSVKEHEYAGDSSSMSAFEFDNSGSVNGRDCVFPLGFDQVLTFWYEADVASYGSKFSLCVRARPVLLAPGHPLTSPPPPPAPAHPPPLPASPPWPCLPSTRAPLPPARRPSSSRRRTRAPARGSTTRAAPSSSRRPSACSRRAASASPRPSATPSRPPTPSWPWGC